MILIFTLLVQIVVLTHKHYSKSFLTILSTSSLDLYNLFLFYFLLLLFCFVSFFQ
jgi:hypothetical protein